MASKARRKTIVGTLSYRLGPVLTRRTTYGGAMRKYANWRVEKRDPEVLMLESIAHRTVAPMGDHGLVIRKARSA